MAAEVEATEGTLASRDGTPLHWRCWPVPSPSAVVAAIHGLGEHGGRYDRLAAALVPHGVACWAVDLRGMGRGAGRRGHVDRWRQWVDDVAAFLDLVRARSEGVEVVPLGHSFGGVLLASAVLDGAVRPDRFVLSNPAFRPAVKVPAWKLRLGHLSSRLAPKVTLGNEVDPALLSRDPAVVAAYREDPLVHDRISSRLFTEWVRARESAMAGAGRLTVPFLLIVSEGDRIIDPEGAVEFSRRAGSSCTMRVYADRYHEPFNDLGANEVFEDLVAWLARRS